MDTTYGAQQPPDPPPGGYQYPAPGYVPPGSVPPGSVPPGSVPPGRPRDLVDDLGPLRRSRSDRVVAGVCGGLGQRLRVDPVLIRVVLAALTLSGGVGLLLYVLAWLFVPEEGAERAIIRGSFGTGSGRGRTSVLAVFLVLAAVVIAAVILDNDWDGPVLLVLAVVALVALLRRNPSVPAGPLPPGPVSGTPAGTTSGMTAGMTTAGTAYDAYGYPVGAASTAYPAPTYAPDAPTPRPPYAPGTGWEAEPAKARERSALFPLTASVTLAALGVLWILDATDHHVASSAYVATALAVVALGLLVGSWFGCSRALIGWGVLLTLALPLALVADHWNKELSGRVGDVVVNARTVSEGSGRYNYGAGDITWDLGGVDYSGGSQRLEINLGAGQVTVTVPAGVDVDLKASAALGDVVSFDGSDEGGVGIERTVTDYGTDGPGGGQLTLDVSTGLGKVVIDRAAA